MTTADGPVTLVLSRVPSGSVAATVGTVCMLVGEQKDDRVGLIFVMPHAGRIDGVAVILAPD